MKLPVKNNTPLPLPPSSPIISGLSGKVQVKSESIPFVIKFCKLILKERLSQDKLVIKSSAVGNGFTVITAVPVCNWLQVVELESSTDTSV